MAKKIPLQNGQFAIVDDEDYEKCMKHTWVIDSSHGAHTKSNKKTLWLSRFIFEGEIKQGLELTYKNHNRLDCRKNNLILVNRKSLLRRSKPRTNSTSKYKGVSWYKQNQKWRVRINVNGVEIRIGLFDSEDEAGKAYNEASSKYFGDDAFQNEIGQSNNSSEIPYEKIGQRRTSKKHTQKLRGVYSNHGRFQARISKNNEEFYLGNYKTEIEAGKAYDKKSYELYGDKAILNFPITKE